MKTTPWCLDASGCGAFRARAGTDGSNVRDRLAFIEKTPRVRIRYPWANLDPLEDWKNWAEGPKGDGPEDQDSRDWCDKMLRLLGYDLG